MTTAHRPTFDPARGKEALRGPAYHQRLLPAHTHLKFRKAGQGGDADAAPERDLAADLLAAEAAHYAKKNSKANGGRGLEGGDDNSHADNDDAQTASSSSGPPKRRLPLDLPPRRGGGDGDDGGDNGGQDEESPAAKRRRILEESREIDADDDSDADGASSDDDDSDEDEDENAELQRELERVRREREEKKKREAAARAKDEQEARERNIALGNPLLNKQDFSIKRRWDDDVVFKNQARGTEDKSKKKEFVNDLLRSDFHRRFMSKYVR